MPKVPQGENGRQQKLFAELPQESPRPRLKGLEHPVWTENKAQLIARYRHLFEMVTKHGTYIDGFAGPQKPNKPEMWSAKLVLELKPGWLRHFYLFEKKGKLYDQLCRLKRSHQSRDIRVFKGDFNRLVSEILRDEVIRQKEATFCLLDQRTFECHWETVKSIARYKTSGPKIELFYFLAYSWLDRALSGQKNVDVLGKWWGGTGWREWSRIAPAERKEYFVERFKVELGYRHALAWPVFRRKHGGQIMYYMVHASDHDEAPGLMSRAYNKTVGPFRLPKQFRLFGS